MPNLHRTLSTALNTLRKHYYFKVVLELHVALDRIIYYKRERERERERERYGDMEREIMKVKYQRQTFGWRAYRASRILFILRTCLKEMRELSR